MKKLVGIVALTLAGSCAAAQQDTAPATREAAVAYWTSGYIGAELVGAGCLLPTLPDVQPGLAGQRPATVKAIATWKDCHRRLMGALAPETAHKAIPAELLASMTSAEREAALRHVAAVHGKLADALQAEAARTIAAQQDWVEASQRNHDGYAEHLDAARDRYAQRR
ncbi:MAG: hypothetical protein ACRYF7_13080 [Janthinobacterium lividum]